MRRSNYSVLGLPDGAPAREVREAFRRLALVHHADRGGDEEEFKRIRRAYEDLRRGKKYPDAAPGGGDDEEEARRRNRELAAEVAAEMALASEWARGLAREGSTGRRLFGSSALGEVEFERKANGALSIKGNVMAGTVEYDGPVELRGSITSPTSGGDAATRVRVLRGDLRMVDPAENMYRIENGAYVRAERGDVVAGNVFGRKHRVQDPGGRVGALTTVERRTLVECPRGSISARNAADTVTLDGDSVSVLNLEDDVRIRAREARVYGSKVTHDVRFLIRRGGSLRFMYGGSVLGFSDDAVVEAEGGGSVYLHDLKTRRVADALPGGGLPPGAGRGDTMVGRGFAITHGMVAGFDRRPDGSPRSRWGFLRR